MAIRPGISVLTRILSAASSTDSVLASDVTPDRSTFDSARFGIGSFTDDEVPTRIAPPPRARIDGTTSRTVRMTLMQQQLERRLPRRVVEAERGARRRAAGVRKQQIDAAELLHRRRVPLRDGVGVAQIGGDRQRAATGVARDGVGGAPNRVAVARGHRDGGVPRRPTMASMPYCTARTHCLKSSRVGSCVFLVASAGTAPACLANAR